MGVVVCAESSVARQAVGEIELIRFEEGLLLGGRYDFEEHPFQILFLDLLHVQRLYIAVDPHFGRAAGGHVQIRGVGVPHLIEQLIYLGHGWNSCS